MDAKRIDINDPDEVRNWCKALDCTAQQLLDAAKVIGASAASVRKHLKNDTSVPGAGKEPYPPVSEGMQPHPEGFHDQCRSNTGADQVGGIGKRQNYAKNPDATKNAKKGRGCR